MPDLFCYVKRYSTSSSPSFSHEQTDWTDSSMLPSLSTAQISNSGSSKIKTNTALANTYNSLAEGTTNYLHTKHAQSLYYHSKQLFDVSINFYPVVLASVQNYK